MILTTELLDRAFYGTPPVEEASELLEWDEPASSWWQSDECAIRDVERTAVCLAVL